jgi:hypothetical protein
MTQWLSAIAAIAGAVSAVFNYLTKSIAGLAGTIYKDYLSPSARRKKEALEKGGNAIEKGNKYDLLDSAQDSKR